VLVLLRRGREVVIEVGGRGEGEGEEEEEEEESFVIRSLFSPRHRPVALTLLTLTCSY